MHGNVVLVHALLASASIARCLASAVCVPGSACEEDEVTLLHAAAPRKKAVESHQSGDQPLPSLIEKGNETSPRSLGAGEEKQHLLPAGTVAVAMVEGDAGAAAAEAAAKLEEQMSRFASSALLEKVTNTAEAESASSALKEKKRLPPGAVGVAMVEGNSGAAAAEAAAKLEQEMAMLLNTEPGLPGWIGVSGANHTKQDSFLLQVGQTVTRSFSGYSGGVGLIFAFTFMAFLCSCCTIMITRAFIQDQRQSSDSLAQHERRQRLLQSFASSVRTPKKGPNGEGVPTPPRAGSAMGVPPTTPSRGRAGAGLRSPWRRVVVDRPLEGDRLGVNLTEDTLIIIDYTDPRAESFGFQVGERVVHINGVPVFQQMDFQKVLSGAFREFHRSGQPIIVSTVEPASSYPNNLNLLPDMEDVCGRWQMTNGEVFVISRLPGLQYLLMTMLAGGQPSASGLVMVHSAEELRCQLIRTDGSAMGDVRICYRDHTVEVTFCSATSGTWGQPLVAWRVTGDGPTPQQTGVSLPPRPTVQSSTPPESLPPVALK